MITIYRLILAFISGVLGIGAVLMESEIIPGRYWLFVGIMSVASFIVAATSSFWKKERTWK